MEHGTSLNNSSPELRAPAPTSHGRKHLQELPIAWLGVASKTASFLLAGACWPWNLSQWDWGLFAKCWLSGGIREHACQPFHVGRETCELGWRAHPAVLGRSRVTQSNPRASHTQGSCSAAWSLTDSVILFIIYFLWKIHLQIS